MTILFVIVILAATLRFYKLDSFPVSLSWDEVAIGYNAYSIAETGADEYGKKWPLLFQSFNDFKLPGYIYLDALFIKLFGLSDLIVRLPSALAGILAVISLYFLTKEILKHFNFKFEISNLKSDTAIIATAMMAISPWHLQFSRAAFEANAALAIVLVGITLLLYGLNSRIAALLSLPFLVFSSYFYYSPRIFVPLILLTFIMIFKKEIHRNLKSYLLGLLLSIIILIPIAIQILTPQGLKRVREVSIFEDQSLIVDYVEARAKDTTVKSALFLNRRIPLVFEALHNYFSHFSFGFLFFGDDPNPRHRASFHGPLYIFEIPLLSLGLWLLLRQKNSKTKYFLLAWLFIGPLPAAFTKETPHSLRSLLMLPPIIILSSLSLSTLANKYYWKVIFAAVIILFFINYLFSYYLVYPAKDNLAWAYGYKQMFREVANLEQNYDRVIVSGHYWKPYIFYLFYQKIDPEISQKNPAKTAFGKFHFGTAGWDTQGKDFQEEDLDSLKNGKTLIVLSNEEATKVKDTGKYLVIETIKDYSGRQTIFVIGEWL